MIIQYKRVAHFKEFLHLQSTLQLDRFQNEPKLEIKHEQLIDKFGECFQLICKSFDNQHQDQRKNMLSYNYVLFKLFQLLGLDKECHEIQMMRSKRKIESNDAMWEPICQDLGWQFIPSISIEDQLH
jgi:hypothetical protein